MGSASTFAITELLCCGTALRTISDGTASMEEAANAVVHALRGHFIDKSTGEPALSLARLYVTRRTDELEPDLRDFAMAAGTDARSGADVICLTLLATAGEDSAWNDRRASVAHKAIPLPSIESLHRAPMVAQLVEQLGLDPRHLVEPDPDLFHDLDERTYNVFYVAEARDSLYVPAQDSFVIPYGIRSVVGFGGVLPDGMLFAVVLFSRVPIPADAVEGFAEMALSTKVGLLDHVGGVVFEGTPVRARSDEAQAVFDLVLLQSRVSILNRLLDVRAAVVETEAVRLEQEAAAVEERATELARSQAALAASEARNTAIVEGALDCVIGMDSHGCIIDFNSAAESTFGYQRTDVIGESLSEMLIPVSMRERHRLGLAQLLETGEGVILGRRIEVNALHHDGHEFPVELTVTVVSDADPPLFTGYLRDLSAARMAALEVSASRERLAHIARTLQASLLPPDLPNIDGFELAAAFHALGDGYEVGGDFYDAFELNDGKWGLSLGDVCGKGSEAAVITALARYTLRASAMRRRSPAEVLSTLNEAILRQHPTQFCTAIYATLDPDTGTVELCVGGHPHPLLLTADGTLTEIGHTSPLLGPFEDWHGVTDTIVLNQGDLLLFYSDGVTEARACKEMFGEDRLHKTLTARAERTADDVVRRIENDVLGFAGQLADDVAILAIRRNPA